MFRLARSFAVALMAWPWASSTVAADGNAPSLRDCPTDAPTSTETTDLPVYVFSSNPFTDWVAYQLTKGAIGRSQKRQWKPDPYLRENETLAPSDCDGTYLNAGRIHHTALDSLTGLAGWQTADSLANIFLQSDALNKGLWERREIAHRELTRETHVSAVDSAPGPLYEHAMKWAPHARLLHIIPSGYWRAIAAEREGKIFPAASIFTKTRSAGQISAILPQCSSNFACVHV